jgi:hypothetical protein
MSGKAGRSIAIRSSAAGSADLVSVMRKAAGGAILKSAAGLECLGGRGVVSVEGFSRKARGRFSLRASPTGASDLMIVVREAARGAVLEPAAGLQGFRRRPLVFRRILCIRILHSYN